MLTFCLSKSNGDRFIGKRVWILTQLGSGSVRINGGTSVADLHGFAENELDFLVNYDIKYRVVCGPTVT